MDLLKKPCEAMRGYFTRKRIGKYFEVSKTPTNIVITIFGL